MKKIVLLLLVVFVCAIRVGAQTCPVDTPPALGTAWFLDRIDQLVVNGVNSPYSSINSGFYMSVTNPFWTLYAGKNNTLYGFNGGGQVLQTFGCYMDFNQNGNYDANERVFGGWGPDWTCWFNKVIPVPAWCPTGQYNIRFRVSATYDQTTACSYCGTGETEDYVVNVIQPATALNFDGIDDYCKGPVSINSSGKFSVEARASMTNTLSAGQIIFYNGTSSSDGIGFYVPPQDSVLNILYGGRGLINTGYALPRDTFATLSAVVEDSLLTFYVNGVNAYSVNTGWLPGTPTGNLNIGANDVGSENFYGSIDEIRVWNRALCSAEITSRALCQLKGNEPALIRYFGFNEGIAADSNLTVTTLSDSSITGSNGTLYNFSLLDTSSNWIYSAGTLTTTCNTYTASFTVSQTKNYVCPGDSSIITVSGATSYTWSTGDTTASIAATPTTATFYTVNAVDPNGCGGTQVEWVGVNPHTATITASANPMCVGDSCTLTANYLASCTWMPPIATGTTATVHPSVNTTYSVTGTTSAGCSTDTATITIVVNAVPNVTAYASQSQICAGAPDSLHATGAAYYTWNCNPYAYIPQSANVVVTPTVSTTYTVIGNDSNNCKDTQIFSVIVDPGFTATISTTQAYCGQCNGSATVTVSGGIAPYQISWAGVGTTPAVVSGLCAGVYTGVVTDVSGCSDALQAVIGNAGTGGPTVTFAISADSVPHVWDVNPSISGGVAPYHYYWNWGDGTSDTVLYTNHTYSVAGIYDVCLNATDASGCVGQYCLNDSLYKTGSSVVFINVVNNSVGVDLPSHKNASLLVYPNPANSVLYVLNEESSTGCVVSDVLGHDVARYDQVIVRNGKMQLDISALPKGIYFLKAGKSVRKFVKE